MAQYKITTMIPQRSENLKYKKMSKVAAKRHQVVDI